jgi:hypothetical protein
VECHQRMHEPAQDARQEIERNADERPPHLQADGIRVRAGAGSRLRRYAQGVPGASQEEVSKPLSTEGPRFDLDNAALRAALLSAGVGLLWVAWSALRRPKSGDAW